MSDDARGDPAPSGGPGDDAAPGRTSPPPPRGQEGPDGGGSAGGAPGTDRDGPYRGARAEVGPARRRRTSALRLGSDLDRSVWVILLVIGAIVLIVLIIVAASRVPSNPGRGSGRGAAVGQVMAAGPATGARVVTAHGGRRPVPTPAPPVGGTPGPPTALRP